MFLIVCMGNNQSVLTSSVDFGNVLAGSSVPSISVGSSLPFVEKNDSFSDNISTYFGG